MAKYTTGYTLGLTKQQFMAAECLFNGMSAREAARMIFDCRSKENPDIEDKDRVEYCAQKIRLWSRQPQFQEAYRQIMRDFAFSYVGGAVNRIAKQVNDENGWLANKAANDLMNRFYAAVMGENDNEVVVKFEGMPELGEPDPE